MLGLVGVLASLAAALPAGAAPPAVSASAYAVSATSSLAGTLIAPTPSGVAGSATDPGHGFSRSAQAGPIGVPGVVSVSAVSATVQGTIDPATGDRTATSTVTVGDLSVVDGLVTGGALTATCTSGGGSAGAPGAGPGRTPSGTVVFTQLRLHGVAEQGTPPPNTVVGLPGVFSAVLNEQTPVATPEGPGLQVRAVDIEVLPSAPGGALLSVVLGQADCGAGGVLPPATTPRLRGPLAAAVPLTSPSPPPSPAASPSPPPSPAASPSPQPSPAASPAPVPAPPPPPAPRVAPPSLVLSPATGLPGSTLAVSATRYAGCPRVVISLGRAQVGSGVPGRSGRLEIGGLTIPGDLASGHYQVHARCTTSSARQRVATFTVVQASVHRSEFATSVITPAQVSLAPKAVAQSAAVAGGFVLVGAFPGELFNATLAENYAEIRGWFGLGPPKARVANRWRELAIFAGFVLVGGVLDAALSPDFGVNRSTLALAIGFAGTLVVLMLVYSLPLLVHIRTRHGEWGVLKVLPGTALVAAACVVISRAVHFEPGYLLGLVAGMEFGRELATDTTGRLTLLAAGLLLAAGVAAWLVRTPLVAAAGRPHAGFWVITLEAGLAALWVAALESCVFTLLPLRYLEGKKLTDWRRLAWAGIFGVAVFAYVHILLQPSSGYVSPDAGAAKWTAIALFAGFGVFSVMFWAYFRFRAPRGEVARA